MRSVFSPDTFIARLRPLGLTVLLSMLVVGTSGIPVVAQNPVPWITAEQRESLLKRLSDSLPSGWSVVRVVGDQAPDEWRTFDTRTLGFEGKNGDRSFHLWIVPEDWVGIRQRKGGPRYGAEVLVLDHFKMILQGDYALYQSLDRWRLLSARDSKQLTVREKPETVAQVEQLTKALVERFCSDQACRDEAAYSLFILGASTPTFTLDCAEHGSGEAQETCLGALQAWPGPETLRVLHGVLSRKPSAPSAVKAATWALRLMSGGVDEASGPPLLEALRNEPGVDAERVLLDALAEAHYRSAAPEILARLERAGKDSQCMYTCAKTLAALRYSPAIPAIQKLVRTKDISSEWLLEEQRRQNVVDLDIPEVALLRLAAPWGAPVNGVRLLLVGPASLPASGDIRLAGLLENESRRVNYLLFDFARAAMIVDGQVYEHPVVVWDGNASLPINAISVRSFVLPAEVFDGKTHRVQIRAASAVSNEIVLTLPRR